MGKLKTEGEEDAAIRSGKTGSEEDDDEDYDDDNHSVYSDDDDLEEEKHVARSPYLAEWLVPLIRTTIAVTPRASNKFLLGVLGPYGNKYALTKAIIQRARTLARAEVFGDADNNAKYILGLQEELRKLGHHCNVQFDNRKVALNRVKLVVLEEAGRHELDPTRQQWLATTAGAKRFVKDWTRANAVFIKKHFGSKEDNWRFVKGIQFTTSTSVRTARGLQQIIQADAAHMNFGKYTLYSAYGTTANAQCSPIAFSIMYGNEDKDGWMSFWEFAVSVHSWLGEGQLCPVTIITDQDKGSKSAIEAILPNAFHFHCSFHRRNNIMKNCKGGVQEYKAAWLFNKLVNAKTTDAITRIEDEYSGRLAQRDLAYLKNLTDEEQYPAARCAMHPNVIMYGRSSSASVESMNAANRECRARTSVCLVNATILLMNLEHERYNTMKELAWKNEGHLTPWGSMLADEASKEVSSPRAYKWTVEETPDYHEYKIQGSHAMSKIQTLRVIKESKPLDYGIHCFKQYASMVDCGCLEKPVPGR